MTYAAQYSLAKEVSILVYNGLLDGSGSVTSSSLKFRSPYSLSDLQPIQQFAPSSYFPNEENKAKMFAVGELILYPTIPIYLKTLIYVAIVN